MAYFPIPRKHAPTFIRLAVAGLTLSLISQNAELIRDLDFQAGDWRFNLNQIGLFWLTLLAPGFCLCALWSTADVFAGLERGDGFGPVLVKGLRNVGSNLLWAAAASVVIVPTLTAWVSDRFGGFHYNADITAVTIGALGLTLWLVAGTGEKMRREMESFV
ncbi:MAG: hypothetical protein QM667_09310 [Asticcacaulis sp.]